MLDINTKKNKGINVLSCFDGISCARVALERAGIKVNKYYSSEIDKYAIQVAQKNYPDTIQLGDVKNINKGDMSLRLSDGYRREEQRIDLLIGGPPCTNLSIAKRNREGLKGEQSKLFWEYVRLLRELKPKYFIMENVASMPQKDKDIITKELGVESIMINATLVSAQQRKRLFWTNIPNVDLPKDRNIYLKDILEPYGYTEREKSLALTATYSHGCLRDYFEKSSRQLVFNKPVRVGKIGKGGQGDRIYGIDGKSVCLSANGGGRGAKTGLYYIPHGWMKEKVQDVEKYPTLCSQSPGSKHLLIFKDYVRKLYPIECERLQGLEDNWTEGISNTQRYKCLGNGFNVDVVSHILKNIKL